MTTIFDLPMELTEEIICRVPKKSMRAVRLTCKTWDTLSKSRSFLKTHLAKTAAKELGESRVIMLMDYNLYLKSIVFNGTVVDPSIEPKGKLNCLNEQVKISQVFHSEGLLLCVLKDTLKLVVWNPYLEQTRWIEPRYFHRTQYGICVENRYTYALGYENKKNRSCPSHKILRFMDANICPNYAPENRFFWYEIYDFDSDLWTTLDVTPYWEILYYEHGVSIKGNTYWCATKSKPKDEVKYIIYFDFTNERFGPFLPLPFSATWREDYVVLSCVGEEKLAVSLQHNEAGPDEIEIWISTKIEAETVLWSKFLKMDMAPDLDDVTFSGSFLIDEEKKTAMGFYLESSDRNLVNFIGEDGYFKGLDLGERAEKWCQGSVFSYAPSLVQIKQNAGCKRKKQSSFETRRFKEKITTLVAIAKPINKERYGLRKRKEKTKTR